MWRRTESSQKSLKYKSGKIFLLASSTEQISLVSINGCDYNRLQIYFPQMFRVVDVQI